MIFKLIKKAIKGITKGVGKLLKGIGGVLKKLSPVLLIGAAAAFLPGALAALGIGAGAAGGGGLFSSIVTAFKAGGWSGAASAFTKGIGLAANSLAGKVLTSAVTYGGYGAVTGAATALLTGQPIGRGIKTGFLAGAAGGAAAGALGHLVTPAAGAGASQFPSRASPGGGYHDVSTAGTAADIFGGGAGAGGGAGTGAGVGAGAGAGGAFLDKALASPVLAGAIQGIGSGISSYAQQKDTEKQRKNVAKSYEGAGEASRLPSTGENIEPVSTGARGRYVYNDTTGDYDWNERE